MGDFESEFGFGGEGVACGGGAGHGLICDELMEVDGVMTVHKT